MSAIIFLSVTYFAYDYYKRNNKVSEVYPVLRHNLKFKDIKNCSL